MRIRSILLSILLLIGVTFGEEIRPYILASIHKGNIADNVETVKNNLIKNNFEIVGEYAVNDNATVLIFTNDEIKNLSAKSNFGGYGAVLRAAVTKVDGKVQTSYINPDYLTNVYRLDGNLSTVFDQLKKIIGYQQTFGSEKGFDADALRKYHYKAMMPYFDDQTVLAKHNSHGAAIEAVEKGFLKSSSSVKNLYKVEIPGKDEVLYGVAILDGSGADQRILDNCDTEALKHTCYLPYEILVSGNNVYTFDGKFRIAISFPDLSMGTFMKISTAPGAIVKKLKEVAE